MESEYIAEGSEMAFRPQALFAFSTGVFFLSVLLAAAPNPLAVALPVAGTLAATGLIWSIDRLQPRFSGR